MSGLKHVKSDFYVSCCYFETTYETSVQLETYLREVVAVVRILRNFMYIILKFLPASNFCHCEYLCETLHRNNLLYVIPYLMVSLTSFCVMWSTSSLIPTNKCVIMK